MARLAAVTTPIEAARMRVAAAFGRVWYAALARLPLPSYHKWTGMLDYLVQLIRTPAPQADPADPTTDPLIQFVEHAGQRWAWRRTAWIAQTSELASALADVMTMTLKSLDMPSHVATSGQTVEIVSQYCPFIRSMVRGIPVTKQVCQRVCGERHSLFNSIVSGLPVPVEYTAPSKMGHGDTRCVKRLRVMRAAGREG